MSQPHSSAGIWTNTVAAAGTAFTPGSALAAVPEPELAASDLQDLENEFVQTLAKGIHGFCFSAYLDGQAPGSQVNARQIRSRMQVMAPYARWVRSFSCTDGNELIPRVAHELGLKTLVGAWLGTNAEINQREIEGVIAVARAGHADMVAVGNEVLLREDLSEDHLLSFIEHVKQAIPGVPVGYVDAYYLFEKYPRVSAACDVLLTNCYPFWEGCPRPQALQYMQTMVRRVQAVAAGKPVVISETGWPDRGSAFHGSVPSRTGAMRYFVDSVQWTQQANVALFYFAAFDEAWKVGAEGDVGAYWGLWDKDARPKFAREYPR